MYLSRIALHSIRQRNWNLKGLNIISTSAKPVIAYEKLPATFERENERGFNMARTNNSKTEEEEQQHRRLRWMSMWWAVAEWRVKMGSVSNDDGREVGWWMRRRQARATYISVVPASGVGMEVGATVRFYWKLKYKLKIVKRLECKFWRGAKVMKEEMTVVVMVHQLGHWEVNH
jgi:hypothetical protein